MYENIQLKISVKDQNGVNIMIRSNFPNTISKDFDWFMKKHFSNFSLMKSAMMYNPVSEQGDMLVIYHQDFWNRPATIYQMEKTKGDPCYN